MAPLVSVVLDTYNHERFIEEAIQSALGQDFPAADMEILVVDDGSTDRTPEIARKFEPHVKLLRKPNGGQASAINYGIAHAKGEFVAFLDGDDVWLPNKLSRVVAEFEKRPEPVLVYHRFEYWDPQDGSVWHPTHFRNVSGDILGDRSKLLAYSAAPTSSLAFRRSVLMRLVPVPEQCSFNHDAYLISNAIFLGPVAAVTECLTRYRIHGQNLYSARGQLDVKALQRRLEVRAATIEAIRAWTRRNAPKRARPQARLVTRKWCLIQAEDEFLLQPPGRLRFFAHRVRQNLTYGSQMTRAHLTYRWVHAFAELIVGNKVHYLEGLRTRARKLKSRVAGTKHASEAGGPAL